MLAALAGRLVDPDEGESNEVLIRRFGFHAVDITACADGRLAGAVDFILRVPPGSYTVRARLIDYRSDTASVTVTAGSVGPRRAVAVAYAEA